MFKKYQIKKRKKQRQKGYQYMATRLVAGYSPELELKSIEERILDPYLDHFDFGAKDAIHDFQKRIKEHCAK